MKGLELKIGLNRFGNGIGFRMEDENEYTINVQDSREGLLSFDAELVEEKDNKYFLVKNLSNEDYQLITSKLVN